MKKLLQNAVAVGLLTSAAIAGVYFSLFFITEEYREKTHPYYALFSDATGLQEGSWVRMAGQPVGSITSIRLERGRARIDIKVGCQHKIYKNAILARRASSIVTGDYFLNLNPGTPDRKQIPPGGRIPNVEEGTEVEAMAARVDEITKDVKAITGSLSDIFGTPEGRERVEAIVVDLQGIAENINTLLQRNSDLVDRTLRNIDGIARESRPEFKEIVSNIRTITTDVREIIKAQEGEVKETVGDLKGSVKTLNSALEKLDRTIEHVEEIASGVKEGKGTIGKLVADEEVAESVADAAEGAGGLLRSIARIQMIVALRGDYNFLASTLKTYVGVYIQPKEDKFYMIEIVDDPRGKTTVQEIEITSTDPEHPGTWWEQRRTTTDALKFSFMFGRRISFVTFRFGIKESSGGIGVDYFLLKDSLKIETDLFDFGSNVYPRLKVAAALRFLSKIYILGGIDDILNKNQQDYFMGAQLRFNDEDLKAVLAFAPTSAVQ